MKTLKSGKSGKKSTSTTLATAKKAAEKGKKLSDLLIKVEELGFQVRKEKLKQGFGWKASSGSCTLKGDRVLFLDSKMSLDEQIYFLSSWLASSSVQQAA